MSGRFVLMGSGEITPSMVTPHQHIGAASGPGRRIALDTPYGFQENADELGERIADYFATNVGQPLELVSLRSAEVDPVQLESARRAVRDAAWVFAGPGSPTYVLTQWRATGIGDLLRERVAAGRTVVLASAAASIAGRRAIPVYEIYKAGFAPWWEDGLDLTAALGIQAVVVPHFDNAEGGTHDTRFCYLGERRLRALEEDLDPGTFILGVDEHTAFDLDLGTRTARVLGRGGVHVRVRGEIRSWQSGSEVSLDELTGAAAALGTSMPVEPPPEAAPATATSDARQRFLRAIEDGDAATATGVALEVQAASAAGDTAAGELTRELIGRLGALVARGIGDPKAAVAPHVQTLLHVRERMRQQRQFEEADHIRDHLTADGVEVRDTPDGSEWDLPVNGER